MRQPKQRLNLEAARLAGPQAVLDAAESLTGVALDMAEAEIRQAQQTLAERALPPVETMPPGEAQESANNDAMVAWDQAAWSQAILQVSNLEEAGLEVETPEASDVVDAPQAPSADRTVGSGCTYSTIEAAMAAANPGDRLLLEGGVIFTLRSHLSIQKDLTFQGGYNGCASSSPHLRPSTAVVSTGSCTSRLTMMSL